MVEGKLLNGGVAHFVHVVPDHNGDYLIPMTGDGVGSCALICREGYPLVVGRKC